MEIVVKQKPPQRTNKWRNSVPPKGILNIQEQYPHVLHFFTVPPTQIISLQEFEELALERLKVLKGVENVSSKCVRGSDEYNRAMEKEIKNTKLKFLIQRQNALDRFSDKNTESAHEIMDCRRLDHISHFILRLAYCRTEELRRWFMHQEMDLFRFRFIQENPESIKEFLTLNNLDYTPISEEEKKEIFTELVASSSEGSSIKHQSWDYYKVDFLEALDLVRGKKVFVSDGFAYVAGPDIISIILTVYRSKLSHALAMTARNIPNMEEDNRVLPMLNNLSRRYLGDNYNSSKRPVGQITADMIEQLSQESYPPCMASLHSHLRKEHHMKHGGRMQYGLFLKGIGLSLDEAMKFWKTEFGRGQTDADKFAKQYAYGIRHNYGKEGKRTNYTPYSCMKIIMSNPPGQGEAHGCPFRHSGTDLLRQKMQGLHLSKDGIDEVITSVKDGNFQRACSVYFKLRHKITDKDYGDVVINHPNQFFEESRKILSGDTDAGLQNKKPKTSGQGVKIVPFSQASQPSTQTFAESQPEATQDIEMDDDFSQEELETLTQIESQTASVPATVPAPAPVPVPAPAPAPAPVPVEETEG